MTDGELAWHPDPHPTKTRLPKGAADFYERGIEVSHETVRFWWHRFGPMFASEIRKRRIEGTKSSLRRWHLGEIFVKINGERHCARKLRYEDTGQEGRLKFLKNAMRKHGRPEVIVTDKLRSYGAARKELGAGDR